MLGVFNPTTFQNDVFQTIGAAPDAGTLDGGWGEYPREKKREDRAKAIREAIEEAIAGPVPAELIAEVAEEITPKINNDGLLGPPLTAKEIAQIEAAVRAAIEDWMDRDDEEAAEVLLLN